MSDEIKKEIKIFRQFIRISQSLDPNLETISLADNKFLTKFYFLDDDPKRECFTFEYEIDREKQIWIYRNITINDNEDALLRKCYLLEIFFTTPMRFDIQTIKIQDFPLDKESLKNYLDDYNSSYQKRVMPQKEVFSKDNSVLRSGVYQITIVRKNHYIPHGYLKSFECQSKPNFIYNFNISETSIDESSGDEPVKIENILYETHFYSLGMELILKSIEDAFYSIRDKIIENNSIKMLTFEEKVHIVRYIFAQYVRTPLERKKLEEMHINMLKKIPTEAEEIRLRMMNSCLNYNWRLLRNDQMEFYTSDNPIILYNNSYTLKIDKDKIRSLKTPNTKILGTKRPHGLGEPGIQIYFPMTPKLCLLMYDPQPTQRILNPIEINEQILIQCYQNILSSRNMIKNFLKRKLNQKRMERERFVELAFTGDVSEL